VVLSSFFQETHRFFNALKTQESEILKFQFWRGKTKIHNRQSFDFIILKNGTGGY
jgi:hypothetical protein